MAEEEELYCLCRRPYQDSEFMIECDVCKDWFHGRLDCYVDYSNWSAPNWGAYYCRDSVHSKGLSKPHLPLKPKLSVSIQIRACRLFGVWLARHSPFIQVTPVAMPFFWHLLVCRLVWLHSQRIRPAWCKPPCGCKQPCQWNVLAGAKKKSCRCKKKSRRKYTISLSNSITTWEGAGLKLIFSIDSREQPHDNKKKKVVVGVGLF